MGRGGGGLTKMSDDSEQEGFKFQNNVSADMWMYAP